MFVDYIPFDGLPETDQVSITISMENVMGQFADASQVSRDERKSTHGTDGKLLFAMYAGELEEVEPGKIAFCMLRH